MTEFISRNHHDSYEVIIKTDCHKHWEESVKFARKLIGHAKPMTNGDRIRAMTDEELAKALGFFARMNECLNPGCRSCIGCEIRALCELQLGQELEWLQQPVKEVDHEA